MYLQQICHSFALSLQKINKLMHLFNFISVGKFMSLIYLRFFANQFLIISIPSVAYFYHFVYNKW